MLRSHSLALRLAGLACVAVALVWLCRPSPFWRAPPATPHATRVSYERADPARQLVTQPIQDLRPGMRVLASNPQLADQHVGESVIEPDRWALITLEQRKPGGGLIEIELIRPRGWVGLHMLGAVSRNPESFMQQKPDDLALWLVGQQVPLNLPELGAVGVATVTRVADCPRIEAAKHPDQRVVTGAFRHSSASLIDLTVEGEPRALGVTDNHPFWSAERHAFVPAGELRIGESLLLADGSTRRLLSAPPRAGPPVPVYNLEVDAQHVYYVGVGGVLVHNTCVYQAFDEFGNPSYFGITIDFFRRQKEHLRNFGRKIVSIDGLDDLSQFEARAVEQVLIDQFGLENLDNVINSISTKNSIYDQSISEGLAILRQIGWEGI